MIINIGFMYYFNQRLSERERIFKLSNAVLNKDNKLVITLIVKSENYDNFLTDELKNKVETVVSEIVPESYTAIVVYKKTITEQNYINQCVMNFIYQESPLVFPKVQNTPIDMEIGYDTVTIKMTFPIYIYSFMETNCMAKKLQDYLDTQIMESVVVEFYKEANDTPVLFKKKRAPNFVSQGIKVIDVQLVENGKIVGSVTKMPKYISEVVKNESDCETICGKVSNLNKFVSKKTGMPFFTFKLNDTTGVINVKYFPKQEKQAELFDSRVHDEAELVIEGPVRADAYIKGNAITLYRTALCAIDYSTIHNEKIYNAVNDDYIVVKPTKYIEMEQSNLFSENRPLPDILKGEIVVFDLETTGLTASSCKIIEVGAVKMIDGVICEMFGSLINPQEHIADEASKVNHIYDKDVAGAPLVADVLADFYKFTRGAVLVAHNAPFDMGFISYHGNECNYNFDNEVYDSLVMARQLVSGRGHRLGDLCKHFDISLENAHRAVDDAEATAKMFRKLCYLQ